MIGLPAGVVPIEHRLRPNRNDPVGDKEAVI